MDAHAPTEQRVPWRNGPVMADGHPPPPRAEIAGLPGFQRPGRGGGRGDMGPGPMDIMGRGVIEAGRGGRGGPMFGRGGRGRGVFGPGDGWRRPDFPPPVAAVGDVGGEREYGPLAGEISTRYGPARGGVFA